MSMFVNFVAVISGLASRTATQEVEGGQAACGVCVT